MKKVILLLLALLLVNSMSAQVEDHLKFMGVPITGTLTEFVAKMEKKGWKSDYNNDYAIVMKGTFANEEAELYIISSRTTHTVWKVAVLLNNEYTSWYSLKEDYNSWKALYSEKYGEPRSYEFFKRPYYEGDGYELQAVELGKCSYISFYDVPLGGMIVEISDDKKIQLSYEDKLNSDLQGQERKKNAMEDI